MWYCGLVKVCYWLVMVLVSVILKLVYGLVIKDFIWYCVVFGCVMMVRFIGVMLY